uniref:Uncharacterized protein n=1 Tax=Moorena producens (strain JHB) TaxID=1454205 RepID=A0A1D9FV62_MOOP1
MYHMSLAFTHEGAIDNVQIFCISDMLPAYFFGHWHATLPLNLDRDNGFQNMAQAQGRAG